MKKLFKMVVNVKTLSLTKWWKMVIFSKFVKKNGEMLKNVGENIKTFCSDLFLHYGY